MVGQFSRDRAIRADKEKAGPDQVSQMLHGGGWERVSPAWLDQRLQGCKPDPRSGKGVTFQEQGPGAQRSGQHQARRAGLGE